MRTRGILEFLGLLLLVPALAGCPTATAPTPPVAPGYLNQADQMMGQVLAGAHAFYQSVQQQAAAGKLVLAPTEKMAMNDLGVAINAAQTLYLAYHNGQATQAQAQASIDQVTMKQNAAQALIPGVQ